MSDAELLALARKLPRGVLARLVAVLEHGAAKYGCAVDATGGGQTALDHLQHGYAHLGRAVAADQIGAEQSRDAETGRLDLDHAAARLVLAMGEVEP